MVHEIRDDGSFTIETDSYYEFGSKGEKLTDEEQRLAIELFSSDRDSTEGFKLFLENGGSYAFNGNHFRETIGKDSSGLEYDYLIDKHYDDRIDKHYDDRQEYHIFMSLKDGIIKLSCAKDYKSISWDELIKAYPEINISALSARITILAQSGMDISNLPEQLKPNQYTISTVVQAALKGKTTRPEVLTARGVMGKDEKGIEDPNRA